MFSCFLFSCFLVFLFIMYLKTRPAVFLCIPLYYFAIFCTTLLYIVYFVLFCITLWYLGGSGRLRYAREAITSTDSCHCCKDSYLKSNLLTKPSHPTPTQNNSKLPNSHPIKQNHNGFFKKHNGKPKFGDN